MLPYTKSQLKAVQKQALLDLIMFAGGPSHLAKMLGKPLSTINSWMERGKISEGGTELVGENPALCGDFPVSRLRPDL